MIIEKCPRCQNEISLPDGTKRGKMVCPHCGLLLRITQVEDDVTVTCPKCGIQFQIPVNTDDLVMCPGCAAILSPLPAPKQPANNGTGGKGGAK